MVSEVIAEVHGFSDPGAAPTPCAVGLEQVAAAETFWLSTVRPDGRPHVTPLIAVWHGDAIWFTTGSDERKAQNLASNPACVLTTGRSDLAGGAFDVVLEGMAEQITHEAVLRQVAEAFAAKYGTEVWHFVVLDGAFSHHAAAGAPWCSASARCAAWGSARATRLARRRGSFPRAHVGRCAAAGPARAQ